MKLSYKISGAPSGRILLLVLAILFTLCVGHANAASEPGTITIVLMAEPPILDPSNSTSGSAAQVLMKNVLETLTEINPADSKIIPSLAHSWKQINPTTWQFFLRKGVKFHDGADFNAEAVVFNVRRLYDPRLKESRVRSAYFSDFKLEGKALDSHTLEFRTDTPQFLLPTLMGLLPLCSPNTPLDKMVRNPIGTGPYKFVRWDAGTQIILEGFDGYWGKKAQVKKAVYVWRAESSVRASMVLIGEADLAPEIGRQEANRPDMDYSYFNSETTSLRIYAWEPPLNDRRVRMALNYAIDRNTIQGTILSKEVVPATQLIVPNIFGYNPDLKVWPYDPQKARQLLGEARKDGVPVDKEILLVSRSGYFPGDRELTETLMTMYMAVGLNVKLKQVEKVVHDQYRRKPNVRDVGPYLTLHMHNNNNGDALFTAYQYHCEGSVSPMCDKMVDDLIGKAKSATGEERRSLWQAAFKRIHEEVIPDVELFHMVGYARVGKRINFKPSLATVGEIQLGQITFKR